MPLAETVIAAKLLRDPAAGRPHVSASLDRVLQILVGHLQDRHGIVVLTGPEGSGKTIALRQLAIDAEPGIIAKTISATQRTTAEDLYKAVLEALKATPFENEAPLARIRRVLSPATTPYPALLVDDAEKLSPSALAALVELAAPGKRFPAVTVLLATRRTSSEFLRGRTLAEAIAGTIAMPRLSPGQVEHFLRSRLRAARLPLEIFPGPVMEALGNLSGGLPGPLTQLAGEALERAAGAGRSIVTLADIADGTAPATPSAPLPPPLAPAAAPEEAALEKALRAAVEDARPMPAPASSGLPPITIAPRPNERPPRPAPSPPSAAAAAPPPPAAAPQRRRTALKASAVAAVALAAVATPVLLLGPRLLEQRNDPAAPGPTALVLPSGKSDVTNLQGPREEGTTAAMPAAAPRPSPDGASPETTADLAPVAKTAAPSAPPARVTEAGPPEPPPFPAAEPVGGTLPDTLSAADSSGNDPVLLPVAATAAASEAVAGDTAARTTAEPASPEAPSAVESTAPPDPPAAFENAVADAVIEPPPPPAAIEETGAAELPDSPAPAPLATTEPAEIADADSPSPSAPLPEPPETANAPEASANADATTAAEPSPLPATAGAADATEVAASPEPEASPSPEPAESIAADTPAPSPPPARAVAAEAAEPPASREAAAAPPDLASAEGDETSAGSAEPAPVAATEPSEPAEAVPPEPAASAVAVASEPVAADSAAEDSAAATTIDAIVGAPPRDEPFDPEELTQLFREAEAAIAAAEAARAGAAPQPAEMAELDPDLRRLFEQFLQSLEATPREADAAERLLHETFQLFLARNAHLFGKAGDPAGDPAMKAKR